MALLFRCKTTEKVYNSTGGTTAASDGGTGVSWEPAEGLITTRFLHASKGPTYRANDNSSGYPGLEWSAGKLLQMAHSADFVGWSSFSWMIVCRNLDVSSSSQYRYLLSKGSSAGAWDRFGVRINAGSYTEDVITFHPGGYTGGKGSESPPNETAATRYVLLGSADGSKICTYVNRQTATRRAITNSITMGTSGLTLGEDVDGSGTYNLTQGVIFEVALWNSALTDSEAFTEIDAAMTRWGVSNTVTPPSSGGAVAYPPVRRFI